MVQAIAFGDYRIQLDHGKAQVLNRAGEIIAVFNLPADDFGNITLPDGRSLDIHHLTHLDAGDLATFIAKGSGGTGSMGSLGSGMFFTEDLAHNRGFGEDSWSRMRHHDQLGGIAHGDRQYETLSGFGELDVIKKGEGPESREPATPHEPPLDVGGVVTNQPPSAGGSGGGGGLISPHAPMALDESLTTAEDTSISRSVTATDPDGDPVTYSLVNGPHHGTVSFNSDGTFTYTPNTHYHGTDSFTYKASDGSHVGNTATVNLQVTPANVAPIIAVDEALTTPQGSALNGSVIANDLNNDPLTYSLVTAPQHGTVTFHADGTFTYTPNAGFSGGDTFTFKANDGSHDSNTGSVTLLVTPVNQAPVAADEGLAAPENTVLTGSVTATDANADHLGYTLVSAPTHGTIVFNSNGTFVYTPSVNYHGNDSFTYKANDGSLDSNVGTVTLTLTSINQAPVASDEALVTGESTQLAGTVTATDYNGDPLWYSLVSGPQHGTVTLHSDGTFTYTPANGYYGTDSFTYKANDGSLNSNAGLVSLIVTPANHAPVAGDEALTLPEGSALNGSVTAADMNGDTLSYHLVSGPQHGTVTFNSDGTFTYTPTGTYHGADSFTYQANDGSLNSNSGTVSLLVTPVNHAPVAHDATLAATEDTILAGNVTASDLNGDALTYALVSGPSHGTITFNADGSYIYTPTGNYNGADSFTFKANDGSLDSNAGTITLNVANVNDAPLAFAGGVLTAEDTVVTGTVVATDVDGDVLTYSLVTGPQHGTLSFHSDGSYTYTPAANYNGPDSFSFKANDGSLNSNTAVVALGITPVNDAPVAATVSISTAEDTALSGSVTAGDVDGDALTYVLVNGPSHGTITFNSDGTYLYTPDANYNGADSFTFKANDGTVDGNTAAVNLTVTPVNDAPVASAATVNTAEDTPLVASVTASDIDGDHLTYSLVSAPQHGTLSFHADGTYTYTPAANYNGADSFTFQASDGSLTSSATINLTVTPVNDVPVAATAAVSTAEDTPLSGSVTASDVDGDAVTYALVSGPAHGTITFNSDGTYLYTPNANYNGSDSFTFKANDGTVDGNTAAISLTVTPVNDAPVANTANDSTTEDTPLVASVTAGDVDGDHLTYSLVTGPQHGTINFHADGTYTYTPAANYNGADSFAFQASDGSLTSNATVSLTVTPVNDAPVTTTAAATTAEDNALTSAVTATDVDGDPLTYRVISGPAHGTLSFNSDGTFTYTPNADYNGSDSFTYKANDGTVDSAIGAVNLTVTAVNDAPVAANASPAAILEDNVLHGSVTATDVDGDHLAYSVVTGPAHGTLSFNSDGTYTYTPAANYNGTDSFTFKANDGTVDSNTATVSLGITAVNDAPTVTVNNNTVVSHINDLSTTYNPLGNTAMGDYLRLQAGSKTFNYPTLARGVDAANIVLAQSAPVTVSYVDTTGGYKSMIGTYIVDANGNIDPASVKFLWLDSTSVTKNQVDSPLIKDFLGNTPPNSIALGTIPAGSHIGTFMISNAANTAANTTLLKGLSGISTGTDNYAADMAIINSKTAITFDATGGHITVNGTVISGQTYFSTNPTWNNDWSTHGVQHMVAGAASNGDGALYVGLEDDYFNKNYDDNVIKYTFGDYNLASITQAVTQPVVSLADVDSAMVTTATVDTHGFQLGDSLHVPSSALFDVTATQSGNDYHLAITAHAGTATVTDLQAYLNTIFFATTSSNETTRTLDYTVSDDQHATSTVVHGSVNVMSSWDVSASMLTASQTSLGSGNDHLRLDAALTHNVDMGQGDNTVGVERNNAAFGHADAQYLTNVQHLDTTGFGTNTVTLNITDVLHVTDGGHTLTITGDAADSVVLNNDGSGHHWVLTDTHGGNNYYTWNDPAHTAVVEISQLMHQTAN